MAQELAQFKGIRSERVAMLWGRYGTTIQAVHEANILKPTTASKYWYTVEDNDKALICYYDTFGLFGVTAVAKKHEPPAYLKGTTMETSGNPHTQGDDQQACDQLRLPISQMRRKSIDARTRGVHGHEGRYDNDAEYRQTSRLQQIPRMFMYQGRDVDDVMLEEIWGRTGHQPV